MLGWRNSNRYATIEGSESTDPTKAQLLRRLRGTGHCEVQILTPDA